MRYILRDLVILAAVLLAAAGCSPAARNRPTPLPTNMSRAELTAAAEALLRGHLDYWQARQFRGGWAQGYDLTTGIAYGSAGEPVGAEVIVLQHESTPHIAMMFLWASELLDDPAYLETAVRTGDLLLALQLSHGGWAEDYRWSGSVWEVLKPKDFNGAGILDDGTPQNSVMLLLWLHRATGDPRYQAAARRALDYLRRAQHPRGSWPQAYPGPRPNLSGSPQAFSVLNDGATTFSAELLLWQSQRDPEFADGRQAFLRAAEWLLAVQRSNGTRRQYPVRSLPATGTYRTNRSLRQSQPVPAWGLQYDVNDALTWARPFEPPAIAPNASRDAMAVLLTSFELTGDRKYLDAVGRALVWFDEVEADGWLLFYDPVRGVPIRAAGGRIEEGAMARPGYTTGEPADWGLAEIRARYKRLAAGDDPLPPGGDYTLERARAFLEVTAGETAGPGGPFFELIDGHRATHAKLRRPWELLALLEWLSGGAPPTNLLLKIDPVPGFPDVLHSMGR